MVAGVLAWADGARPSLRTLADVLVGGVMEERGLSAMLRLWAIVIGLQLRELLCMSNELLRIRIGACIGS